MTESRWVSAQHWRRATQQSRSEKTQNALLDAAEALILEHGTEATSISDIAGRAGFSVGTLYHHFKDKTALFYALFHRMTETYSDHIRQASDPALWQGASVSDVIRGYVEAILDPRKYADPSKAAANLVVADHPDLRAHIAEIQAEGRRAVVGLILDRRAEIGHPTPDDAVPFWVDQVGAMALARVSPDQRAAAVASCDDAAFMDRIEALTRQYLQLG